MQFMQFIRRIIYISSCVCVHVVLIFRDLGRNYEIRSLKIKLIISYENLTPNKHIKKTAKPFSSALHRFQHLFQGFQLESPSHYRDHFYVVILKKIPLNWMKYTFVILEPYHFIVSVRVPRRNAIILIVITITMITVS